MQNVNFLLFRLVSFVPICLSERSFAYSPSPVCVELCKNCYLANFVCINMKTHFPHSWVNIHHTLTHLGHLGTQINCCANNIETGIKT